MAKKICFVGLDNYPVLNPSKGNEYFGGESVQQTLLAKAFYELGYEVTMVVGDYGQPRRETIDGIKVISTFAEDEGVPVLRYVYPRMTSVWSALKEADADVYFQSCAGVRTGLVARFCKRYNRKFIFRLAHDSDCIPGQQIIPYWRDRKIYEYGLKRTDLISAQGVKQVELLFKNYGLPSTPINMTVQLPDTDINNKKDIDILWVNNLRDFKRPELVPELAKMLPNYNITMIGGAVPGNDELYNQVKQLAEKTPNLDFKGVVAYHDINAYFLRSKLFVNTSDWEGFPNSFLQAWIRKVPVLSFFDPDGLIASEGLGAVPSTLNEMAASCDEILGDDKKLESIGATSEKFALENYSPVAVATEYEELLQAEVASKAYE